LEAQPVSLSQIPSVDRLLRSQSGRLLQEEFGHAQALEGLRSVLEALRPVAAAGQALPELAEIVEAARLQVETWLEPSLRPVINASGVIIHTNLGRAPLSRAAADAVRAAASGYSTLEYQLSSGQRGSRQTHAESLLRRLCGAEAAMVVNNNAAAVLLALAALARRREVLISRSQLIEIGGGFRIPDVMRQSEARLVEIGTTNRTHLADYEHAIHSRTALIFRAHHSNFKIEGFATEPGIQELVELGRRFQVAVFDDLGSGALLDTARFGLAHEPMVQESLQCGAGLVAFSGDKLLGGPQAGIVVGRRDLLEPLRRHPLARAMRPDKLCLAALAATLRHYLVGQAVEQIPVWQMIAAQPDDLARRAANWRQHLGQGRLAEGRSTVGGGSLPQETLPTHLLALKASHPDALAGRLRNLPHPIIGRIEAGEMLFDPRTVLPEQEPRLLDGLAQILGLGPSG
jgi:L-seryl-tRNA(Ser) seleniumtransferase